MPTEGAVSTGPPCLAWRHHALPGGGQLYTAVGKAVGKAARRAMAVPDGAAAAPKDAPVCLLMAEAVIAGAVIDK